MNLYKFIMFCFAIVSFSQASWVEEYQKGEYQKETNKIYAMVQKNITQDDHKTKAFQEAVSDISSQLFTYVSSQNVLDKTVTQDNYSQSFTQKIYTESSLPILSPIKEQESIVGDVYYLLVAFDKNSVAYMYKTKANELAVQIDTYLEKFKALDNLQQQESYLQKINALLENFEKHATVAKLLKQTGIMSPKIDSYFVEKELSKIYNKTAKEIKELSSLLAKSLTQSKIKNSIQVLPFSYSNTQTYSPFALDLQNNLENALNKHIKTSINEDSLYKISGTYWIKDRVLFVKAMIYDSFGDVIKVAVAKMTISANDAYYLPKINEYDTMNQLVLNPNLDLQVRMNRRTKELLFQQDESVNLEVKVSKEAYLYVVGNMRTKDGKQLQYLLPLSDSSGVSRFQQHIPYQNSNLWVSLGEFEVYPPFGVEVLQVFASNVSLVGDMPYTKVKNIDGEEYDIIVDKNLEAMPATRSIEIMRGLKKKKVSKEIEQTESIIKFTTVKKHND